MSQSDIKKKHINPKGFEFHQYPEDKTVNFTANLIYTSVIFYCTWNQPKLRKIIDWALYTLICKPLSVTQNNSNAKRRPLLKLHGHSAQTIFDFSGI